MLTHQQRHVMHLHGLLVTSNNSFRHLFYFVCEQQAIYHVEWTTSLFHVFTWAVVAATHVCDPHQRHFVLFFLRILQSFSRPVMPVNYSRVGSSYTFYFEFYLCFGFLPWFLHLRFMVSVKNFHFGASQMQCFQLQFHLENTWEIMYSIKVQN